jgi:hypothetical protein
MQNNPFENPTAPPSSGERPVLLTLAIGGGALLFGLLLVGVLSWLTGEDNAPSGTRPAAIVSQAGQPYQSKEHGYSIQLPSEWHVYSDVYGAEVHSIALTKGANPPAIRVVSSSLSAGDTVASYWATNKSSVVTTLPDCVVREEKQGSLNGLPAISAVLTYTGVDMTPLTMRLWLITRQGRGYVLSAIVPSQQYGEYDDLVDTAFRTFAFK